MYVSFSNIFMNINVLYPDFPNYNAKHMPSNDCVNFALNKLKFCMKVTHFSSGKADYAVYVNDGY